MNRLQRTLLHAMLLAASTSVAAAQQLVTIENFTFKPAAVTVHAGAKVTFKNVDDIPHSVVLVDGTFHSHALDTNDEVSIAFARVGEYSYFCGLHPHMQGKVVVVP